jgi:pimeloyl-ACP methyl ester carboxylesterase
MLGDVSGTNLARDTFWAETKDGWQLHVQRTERAGGSDPSRRPLLIVPGYGMNGFIFGFHPRGTSLESHLALSGVEVWTANLRGQGRSRRARETAPGPTMERYGDEDVTAAVETVLRHTRSRHDRLDVLGASLGGSITFVHLALRPAHRVASVIAVGSPLVWEDVPLFLRVPFASRRVAGALRVKGARAMAGVVLPVLKRAPGLLGMYMNASHVDLSAASELIRTVEDPDPGVNRDIAAWMKTRDLVAGGVNVTEAVRRTDLPLLVVLANRDGIVPEKVASSVARAWGGKDVTTLRIGTDDDWYAHADLFVGDDAPRVVFDPIARWLAERG